MFMKIGEENSDNLGKNDKIKSNKNSLEVRLDNSQDGLEKLINMFADKFSELSQGKEIFENISKNIRKVSERSSRQNSMSEEKIQEKSQSSPINSLDNKVLSHPNGSQTERISKVKESSKKEEKCLTERLLVKEDPDTSYRPELIEDKENQFKQEILIAVDNDEEEKKITIFVSQLHNKEVLEVQTKGSDTVLDVKKSLVEMTGVNDVDRFKLI